MGPGKFLRSKTRRAAQGRSFRVPLRGRLPVLHSCPFSRLAGSLLEGQDENQKNSASTLGQRHVAASDSWPLLERCSVRWLARRASERPLAHGNALWGALWPAR